MAKIEICHTDAHRVYMWRGHHGGEHHVTINFHHVL